MTVWLVVFRAISVLSLPLKNVECSPTSRQIGQTVKLQEYKNEYKIIEQSHVEIPHAA